MANAQRKRATLETLSKKKRTEKLVTVTVPGDDGEPEELEMLFRSIGYREYDKLVTKYPPTALQKKEGLTYDLDKFGPALLSRVCVDPPMSLEDAETLWESEDWNRGEVMSLFFAAVEVCTNSMAVPPTESE